jgi:hypothetical protein
MKISSLLAGLRNGVLAMALAAPVVSAQEDPAAESVAVQQEDPVVYVEAWRRDRALDAFLRGDFATAEVEFRKNEQCIRRVELQIDGAIRQGLVEQDRTTGPQGNGPGIHNLPLRPEQIRERTCHSKQWQLYMIGLSQIQLGRFEDAKKSLYSVTRMSKEDLLFDAHFRVGLLELLEGDIEKADRRLSHLAGMQRSCRARSCEVDADLTVATTYLTNAVAAARHGARQ